MLCQRCVTRKCPSCNFQSGGVRTYDMCFQAAAYVFSLCPCLSKEDIQTWLGDSQKNTRHSACGQSGCRPLTRLQEGAVGQTSRCRCRVQQNVRFCNMSRETIETAQLRELSSQRKEPELKANHSLPPAAKQRCRIVSLVRVAT